MEKEFNLYEIMYELAEEEKELLQMENQALKGYIEFLQVENKDLVKKFNSLFDIRKRKN